MSTKPRDPLLASARILVLILYGFVVFAMVMVAIGFSVALFVKRPEILAKIAEAGAPEGSFWLIIAVLLMVEGLLYLAVRFFRELNRIIASVGEGEAFNAENANRLSRMGWIIIAAQGVGLLIGSIAVYLAPFARRAGHSTELGFGFDGGGILAALLLFILARVFREGTRMREELEGTV